jgi:hypothetical protein
VNVSHTDNPAIPAADPSASAATSPDWEQITREITCPLCGYNLRGLTHPVCPECGHHFDWPAVLNPHKNLHPYLFEHHPERNIESFLRTILRNGEPFTFWKTVRPTQPLRLRRLLVYWAACCIVLMLPAVLTAAAAVSFWLSRTRQAATVSTVGHFLSLLLAHDRVFHGVIACSLLFALFPFLNFLALRVFAQSMRRAKIKPSHVLRCVIYSADVMVWNALIDLPFIGWFAFDGRWGYQWLTPLLGFSAIAAAIVNAFRLISGYRHYMQFEHVIATIVASQLILFLTMLTLLALLANVLTML